MQSASIDETKKAILDFISSILPGVPVVWGNQNAPAPAGTYAALFYTGEPGEYNDAVVQGNSDSAFQVGERTGSMDIRIIGSGSFALACELDNAVRGESFEILDLAGVAITTSGTPQERTALHPNGNDYTPAAAYNFGVVFGYEKEFQRDYIETTTVRGELRYGEDGQSIEIIT